jgi:hypothetical protein
MAKFHETNKGTARNDVISLGGLAGWDHDDVTFFPFLGISKKYNSDQNYVYNFSFPKMDDDLWRGGSKILKFK